ncbi:MAG: outer membrane lipoprotein-sorting protein [Chitinivibrionales bacterium]|nr:outer membrane lipoprotein-sorting protein [Chitinivibrionales bacterium]MBD3395140.1 outer membrane lipoprotein-sorting protein [Chitinivibrionales bacterium]
MEMTIHRSRWTRSLSMEYWSKGDSLSVIYITAPPRERGTAFLKRGTEVWQWQPAIERIIKIPPSMMSQSWMGSDFTNDDLVKEASIVDDYTHTLLGDSTIRGHECHLIQMVPRPAAPIVWSKVLVWIEKDRYIELRAEYYNEQNEQENTLTLSDIKQMGGREIPTRWTMSPANEPQKSTTMRYESMEFNTPIRDSFFAQRTIKRMPR